MRETMLTPGARFGAALTAAGLFALAAASPLAAHGEAEETIYVVEGDVQKPLRLGGDAPVYPEEARKERVEGLVVVRAVIGRDGKVAATEVVESAREDLDAAAADAIGTWTFEPATLDGEPVPVYYHLTVNFRLDRDAADDGETG